MLRTLLLASLVALPACGQQTEPAPSPQAPDASAPPSPSPVSDAGPGRLEATIIGDSGDAIGTAALVEGPNGVIITIELSDGSLEDGMHGLHIHTVGDCSDIGDFKRSGGHLGKIEGGHGLLNPQGPEMGDLPNIHVDASGAAHAQMFSALFGLGDLQDDDGAALIMHEAMDDHISQPIGGAGARVACAVLSPPAP